MTSVPAWYTAAAAQLVSPHSKLHGSYACRYAGFQHVQPPYAPATGVSPIPQIGGFVELLPPSQPGTFQQVAGYVPMAFTGIYVFDGAGNFSGYGKVSQGPKCRDVAFGGDYSLTFDPAAQAYHGTIKLDTGGNNTIDHYFVVADFWREILFIITGTTKRQMTANGSMIRIA